jgi:hypothetical protein
MMVPIRIASVLAVAAIMATTPSLLATIPAPTELLGIASVKVVVTSEGEPAVSRTAVEETVAQVLKERGMRVVEAGAPTLWIRVTTATKTCGSTRLVALHVEVDVRDDVSLKRDVTIELQRSAVTWSKDGLVVTSSGKVGTEAIRLAKEYVVSFLDNAEWVKRKYR